MSQQDNGYIDTSKAILEILKHQTTKIAFSDYLKIFFELSKTQTQEQLNGLVDELKGNYPFLEEVDLEYRNIQNTKKEDHVKDYISSLIKSGDLEKAQEFAAKTTDKNVSLVDLLQDQDFANFINSKKDA